MREPIPPAIGLDAPILLISLCKMAASAADRSPPPYRAGQVGALQPLAQSAAFHRARSSDCSPPVAPARSSETPFSDGGKFARSQVWTSLRKASRSLPAFIGSIGPKRRGDLHPARHVTHLGDELPLFVVEP